MGGQLQQFTEMLCWLADARDISTGVASASRTLVRQRGIRTARRRDGWTIGGLEHAFTDNAIDLPIAATTSIPRLTPAHIKPLDPRLPPSHRSQGLSLVLA